MSADPEDQIPWFFNAEKSVLLAKLSRLAYKKPDDIDLSQFDLNMDVPFNYKRDKEDTQGFICSDAESVYVVFRGTSSFFDIITDLKIFKTKVPWMKKLFRRTPKAHSGFTGAYEPVHERLIPNLLQMVNGRRVFVTGHSLGGALATLCAIDLAWHHKIPVHVYTFGSPRVGDKRFAKKFKKMIPHSARVRNHNDKIPLFPNLLYKHVAHIVHMSEDGKYIAKHKKWDKSSVPKENQDLEGDHRIDSYVKALEMVKVSHDMKPFGGGKY